MHRVRGVAIVVFGLALFVLPPAATAAPTISYTVTAGTPGDNGWYLSNVTVAVQVQGATSTTCFAVYTLIASGALDCSAGDGTFTVTLHKQFNIDKDAPGVTGSSASRPPNGAGWYNAPVTISFTGSDATSGLASCTQASYSGPDAASAGVSGTCRDNAGNISPASTFSLKYDATPPTVGASASRVPDLNGWYNHGVGISFSATDMTSGVAAGSCTSTTYSGPDGAGASAGGSCRDVAGNTRSGSFSLNYDATSPTITNVAAQRLPDKNGWYNHPLQITFASSDATSGIDGSCSSVTYSGPESASASAPIVCRDRAGNANAPISLALEYDATAPAVSAAVARAPNANGWYNAPVAVAFTGDDAVSRGVTCEGPKTYSGGDSANANVPGTCIDVAGNTGVGGATFGYDATPPTATGMSPDRGQDANGWYNHPLTVTFAGTDATSGIEGCSSSRYDGPDSSSASVAGSCSDRAGNVAGAGTFGFQFDATGPSVRANPARGADASGWYNHSVAVAFAGSDNASGVDSCTAGSYAGPDSASATVGGSCSDRAGNVGSASFGLKYDATPPVVAARPARAADGDGWYTHPVEIQFSATDALSGADSCTSATYRGPDTADADIAGSCRDAAGNSNGRSLSIRYDATPPSLRAVTAVARDRTVHLSWKAAAGATTVTVARSRAKGGPIRRYAGAGRSFVDKGVVNGTRYRYVVTARDAAGNAVSKSIAIVPLALFAPPQGARLSAPPLLEWSRAPRASYYNVQVMHDGKVLSTWPTAPRFQMPRRWRFGGTPHVLEPGLYRWYVWPGFGARAQADYGERIGGSFFVIAKS